jgi:hypothetical protein
MVSAITLLVFARLDGSSSRELEFTLTNETHLILQRLQETTMVDLHQQNSVLKQCVGKHCAETVQYISDAPGMASSFDFHCLFSASNVQTLPNATAPVERVWLPSANRAGLGRAYPQPRKSTML